MTLYYDSGGASIFMFLETRLKRLLDGLIFVEKGLGVHVHSMLKMCKGYILVGVLSKTLGKSEGKLGTLFAIIILQINDLVPAHFY